MSAHDLNSLFASYWRRPCCSKYDELLCHQAPTTFDHVVDSGDNWRENAWICAHDITGKFFLSSHFGVSTNRNVMDASGLLALDNKTRATSAHHANCGPALMR